MKHGRGDFTLVELLIVMAIASILMAMLLPILNNARKSAQAVYCANQEKQMYFGVLTVSEMFYKNRWLSYADESVSPPRWGRQLRVHYFKGRLDPSGKSLKTGGWDQKRNEAEGGLPLLCPRDIDYQSVRSDSDWEWASASLSLYTSYGLNQDGFGVNAPAPQYSQILWPSKTVLLGDSSGGMGLSGKSTSPAIRLSRYAPVNAMTLSMSSSYPYLGIDRHMGRANVAFADGHVKSHAAPDLLWSSSDPNSNIAWLGRPEYKTEWWK